MSGSRHDVVLNLIYTSALHLHIYTMMCVIVGVSRDQLSFSVEGERPC